MRLGVGSCSGPRGSRRYEARPYWYDAPPYTCVRLSHASVESPIFCACFLLSLIITHLPCSVKVSVFPLVFMHARYGSLTERAVVSLSELSSRLGPDTPSNATWEGRHVRCFERMVGRGGCALCWQM